MSNTPLADRRDHIIDRLSSSYANGAFEVEELERRVALVHDAQTSAELDALVTELVPAGAASVALVPAKRVRIVMGAVERTGPWAVPQHLAARVVFGHLLLDLREARLVPGVTTIEVNVTMGNVEVIVPPGVGVEVEASSFLGAVEQRTEPVSGAAVVRVVGRVKLGSLELTTRQLGETARDARRRDRSYRRWRERSWHR